MTKSAKTFMIVAAALLVTCFGGGYYLLNHYAGPMMEQTKIVVKEGKEFGINTENSACLSEAKTRYTDENEMTGGMKEMMFLSSCLRASKVTPGFCDGVPSARDIAKSQPWQKEQCGGTIGPRDVKCSLLMAALQEHCHPARGRDTA